MVKLKNVTESIENAKDNSLNIINELENVQKNFNVLSALFSEYTDKLYNTYKENVNELKQSTEFLEKYSGIVEVTDSLLKVLTEINFPERISNIEETQKLLLEYLAKQQRELKTIRVVVFITCGLVILAAAAFGAISFGVFN